MLDGKGITMGRMPKVTMPAVAGSERLTGALFDRLTHHVHILEMNGESFRLNQSKRRARQAKADDPPANPA